MASSIRSRLWFSYFLVIAAALTGMIGSTISTVSRSPLFYRQPILQLRLAESTLASKIDSEISNNPARLRILLTQQAGQDKLRYAVIDNSGQVIMDSGRGLNPPIPMFDSPPKITGSDPISFDTFQDTNHKIWLFVLRPLDQNTYLLAASRQPVIELGTMMRDEIIRPMVQGSGIALILAFIMGLFLSAWIGNPLKRLADGARQIESGSYPVLEKEGPREIQELAESFNQMSKRVRQTEESQRDFLANVSHELKTPLTSIQGFAQSILDGT
ncbi:MAG TPA: HAMP domain-containing sensor histidine kinase, partial [Leptolinea sp.]